jgi:lipid A 4'-phosphatase
VQCGRNCSFVSGEASSAFWTLAPALLAPPPVRPLAVGAALVFGSGVAALRMAFGGHYLSDSLISGLLTILLVLGLHRAFFGRVKPAPSLPERDPGLRRPGAPL